MSTRSLITVAGGIVGAYFGYPQLGLMLGALVGGVVDPGTIQGPAINEVTVQTQAEGVPRIIPYGTVMCVGNVIQNSPLIKTTESSSAGKGGQTTETPTAYRSYLVAICEGPIAGILRVWEDNTLVYDVRLGSLMLPESFAWAKNKVLHPGDETQVPDAFMSLYDADTPAYRGTAYMVFGLENVTSRGGSFPQYRWEVAKALTTVTLPVVASTSLHGIGVGNGAISGPTSPGQGGGSTFTMGQVESATGFLGSAGQLENGNVYLMNIRLQARASGFNVTAYLKLGGEEFWSDSVALSDGQYHIFVVQLNHTPDGSAIEVGFVNNSSGSGYFSIALNQLASGTYDVYDSAGLPVTDIFLPSNPMFGLVRQSGSGDPYTAGAVNAGSGIITPWGPTTIVANVGSPTTLKPIVDDIHQRCGIESDLYDTTELTQEVDGFSMGGPYSGADAINALRAIYMFDKSDHDGKLWYPNRGKPVVRTLTIDDLTEIPDTSTRNQVGEIPYRLNLAYQNAIVDYATVKATSPLTPSPDRRTTGEVSMQTAIVLSTDAAAQAADKIYKITLAEANGTVTLSVPLANGADLADADCIGLFLRGQTWRLRIDSTAYSAGVFTYTLRNDRQSAYTSNVTGIPLPPPTLPPSTIVGETELAILDIPARTDTEDDLNYLAAVTGALPPWYGAQLQRSLDGGANYSNVQQITNAAHIGTLTASITDASRHYTDHVNVVQVQFYRDTQTLDSLSDQQFLSEQGAFALLKADGTWEVMQYRDAHEDSAGVWHLSTLHRGLLNTGGAAHLSGAVFVLLEDAVHIAASASWLGLNLTHRAITLGETADDTTNDQTITYVGRSQIEWPVTYLAVARSVGNVLTGSWVPRPRLGSDVNPIQSVNWIGYRVTIVDAAAVTVTFDVASAAFTYDASAMTAPCTISVSALNRITGEGPSVSTTA